MDVVAVVEDADLDGEGAVEDHAVQRRDVGVEVAAQRDALLLDLHAQLVDHLEGLGAVVRLPEQVGDLDAGERVER